VLAPRTTIERGGFVPHPCSHDGIRCKHRQCERTSIPEYPLRALDQFVARIVARQEKGCGELDAISQEINLIFNISYSYSAIAALSLSLTLSAD